MAADLRSLEPVPTLLERVRRELPERFGPARRLLVSRAPGRLDVMGGIADYTGSLVCEMPLRCAAAVASQPRGDRRAQVFSFDLLDAHEPFTLEAPLDALAGDTADLRREFAAPGRRFAAYLLGCLHVLHRSGLIDLRDPAIPGLDLALHSTVPIGGGVSSSAAMEVAAMFNVLEHVRRAVPDARLDLDPMRIARLCQEVENDVVGVPCGVMDQVTSCYGRAGAVLRLRCQPHELLPSLPLPEGVRCVGLCSRVRHSVGDGQYGRTRCAAAMGQRIILEKMRQIGRAAGRELVGDPTGGYLANLDLDDFKRFFRGYLPEQMKGGEFLLRYQSTSDAATRVELDTVYPVQGATEHHVQESRRARQFAELIEAAGALPAGEERSRVLDMAGHLMYASHVSYGKCAMLGNEACDVLVDLVRAHEREGFFGARISGGGQGGTVAVLCLEGARTHEAIASILSEYERRTGQRGEAIVGSSDGAWHVGAADL